MSNFFKISTLEELLVYADTLNIFPDSDSLLDMLFSVYEWEYKYHKIKNSQNTNKVRKEKVLERIEREVTKLLFTVADKLLVVYNDWLSSHALTNPEEWAKVRYMSGLKSGMPVQHILTNALNEYRRYADASPEQAYYRFIYTNYAELSEKIQEIITLKKNAIQEDINIEDDPDELSYLQSQLNEINQIYLSNPNQVISYLDYEELMEDVVLTSILEEDPEELIVNFLENDVFEMWYLYWGAQGIDETRERVEQMANELNNIGGKPLSEKFTIINKALNTAHQSGSMMEYVQEEYDIGFDELNKLSNLDTNKWDTDLNYHSLKAMDSSFIRAH